MTGNFSFKSLLNKIHLDSVPEFLENIPDDTIGLTLTSPPFYDDELYVLEDEVLEFGWGTYDEYLEHLKDMLEEVYRITIPGGKFVAVLSNSPKTDNNEYITDYWPLPLDMVNIAREIGWQLMDEIIWVKQEDTYEYIENDPVPETHARVKHDVISVLRKPGSKRDGKTHYSIDSVWHLQNKGPIKGYNKAYPSFPNELVEKVLKAWSLPNDIILDPYAGSGQVCRIALKKGRFCIGVEIDKKWEPLWKDINIQYD